MWTSERRRVVFACALLCAVAFLVVAGVAVTHRMPGVDLTARAFAQWERQPLLDPPMQALSRLGSGWVIIPLTLLIGLVLWRVEREIALLLPALTAGSVVLESLTKFVVARPRPNRSGYGFPSGHVLTTIVFVGAVVYVVALAGAPRVWRRVTVVVGALFVVGVAASRLYLNAHWLTDVVGAATGGAAYLLFVLIAVDERVRGARRRSEAEAPIALLEGAHGAEEVDLAERRPVDV